MAKCFKCREESGDVGLGERLCRKCLEEARSDETSRDLLALYERGEITAEEFVSSLNDESETIDSSVKPFKSDKDDEYITLNVLERGGVAVTFRMGIQLFTNMEFLGFRKQVTMEGKHMRQTTNCKYRAANGVTLVSMLGPLEWCPDGYYYALAKADHLGASEFKVGEVYIQEEEPERAVLGPDMAKRYREMYEEMGGSSRFDPEVHNQVIRGKVLKVLGTDRRNQEISVSLDDFEAIEFAVRAYNKYMNDNAVPGEFNRHVAKMMDTTRQLT